MKFESLHKKIKALAKKWKMSDVQLLYALGGSVLIIACLLGGWFVYRAFFAKVCCAPEPIADVFEFFEDEEQMICDHQRLLDGMCVESEEKTNERIVTIMIENHPEARPQSGLAQASVVYEAPVEANYTRFMAVYPASSDVGRIGPVRSVRPYYIDWVSEYDNPMYMHVGGSPAGLDKIGQFDIFSLNEFYRGWYYWRAEDRAMPHNVYTSSQNWYMALEEYDEQETSEFESWTFSHDDEPCTEDCIEEIVVSYLPPTYEATWKYNTTTGQYVRYQSEGQHRDSTGKSIVADTVIVQFTNSEVLDSIGRIHLDATGEEEVLVFRDGKVTQGVWKKDGRVDRTTWIDWEGNDIALKPGKIWVQVVNQIGSVSYQ